MFTRVNIFRNRIKGDGNESRNEHLPGCRKESPGSDPMGEAVQINFSVSRSVSQLIDLPSQDSCRHLRSSSRGPIVNIQT